SSVCIRSAPRWCGAPPPGSSRNSCGGCFPRPSPPTATSPPAAVNKARAVRVAVFSDVHGNVRALEAVLAELGARGPFDHVINGGDLAYGGTRARGALGPLVQRGCPAGPGSTDVRVPGVGPGGGGRG